MPSSHAYTDTQLQHLHRYPAPTLTTFTRDPTNGPTDRTASQVTPVTQARKRSYVRHKRLVKVEVTTEMNAVDNEIFRSAVSSIRQS